jgi:hypothetical protein
MWLKRIGYYRKAESPCTSSHRRRTALHQAILAGKSFIGTWLRRL